MKKKKFELIFPGYTYIEESKPDAGRIVFVQLDFTRNGRWSSTSFTICKVSDDGSLFYEDKKKKLKTLKEGDLDSRGDVQHITAWKYIQDYGKDVKVMIDEEIERDLKEMVPEDTLTDDEKEYAMMLSKYGYTKVVKYINTTHPDLGLKCAKTYYDLYIKK